MAANYQTPTETPKVGAIKSERGAPLLRNWWARSSESANALVEVNRYKDEAGLSKPLDRTKSKALDDLSRRMFVNIIPVDLAIGLEARRIVRETPKFKNKFDTVHIASATRFVSELMHTFDRLGLLNFSGVFP